MRLEDVTAEIRPRVPWESIDLGCALARKHMGALWKSWLITILPLWVLLAVLLRNHPIWFMLITWWLKPVYDRVPLLVVSRALFGAVPTMKEVLRAWPRLMVRRLWFALVVGRFSPARGLTLPVSELEGLRGVAYRQRVNLLERNGGEGATMATLAGLLLEFVAGLGMVVLVMMMVPETVSGVWIQGVSDFLDYGSFDEISNSMLWTAVVVRLLSFVLMEPFYVAAGFALYINSRTLTEGWDIELAFKRLGTRLEDMRKGKGSGVGSGSSAMMLLLVVVCGFMWMANSPLHAQDGNLPSQEEGAGAGVSDTRLDPSQRRIKEVLEHQDFTVHSRIEEVPVESSSSRGLGSGGAGMGMPAVFGNILFFIILAAVVAGLAYLIYANRHIFVADGLAPVADRGPKTREVMGMTITPESLPDDVVAAARAAWQAGDHQLALSYLYRGSITWLVHRADLPIEESDTEGDCLRRVKAVPESRIVSYFTKLTDSWVGIAYGQQKPDDRVMAQLCEGWPFQEQGRRDQ